MERDTRYEGESTAEESSAEADSTEDAAAGSEEEARREAWDPWGALSNLQEAVGGVVDSALRGVTTGAGRFPRHDLLDLGDEGYRVLFDLPGLEKGDVDVTISARALTIAGERPRPTLPEGARVQRSERPYGRFRRSIELPPGVDPDGISARMERGVLEVRLPLQRAEPDAKKVVIE